MYMYVSSWHQNKHSSYILWRIQPHYTLVLKFLKHVPAMLYISHALRIKAIALQVNFGTQLPLNQFKGFSQQLSDSIRRHSLLIAKKPKPTKKKKKKQTHPNNLLPR